MVAIYSTFLNRAWDQVYYDVGLHRLPVIFCIDRAGITGRRRSEPPRRHGPGPLDQGARHDGAGALFLRGDPGDAGAGDRDHERTGRAPLAQDRGSAQRCHGNRALGSPGARRCRVCFFGLGKMVEVCEHAAEELSHRGIEATVWDVRAAAPLDPLMLCDALRHDVVVTVEDGVVEGGVGASIGTALRATVEPGATPGHRVVRAAPSYFPQGKADHILSGLGLDGPGLAQQALTLCAQGGDI